MDSQREYSPEVISKSEMMDELIQIKCDHPRRIIQHNKEDKRPMIPASCPKCCDLVRTMANLFLQTCPHSWAGGEGTHIIRHLSLAIDKNEVRHPMDIAGTITFRWKAAQLADRIVKELNLPIPSNKTCIMWEPCYWRSSEAADYWQARDDHDDFVRIARQLEDRNLPMPSSQQGPPSLCGLTWLLRFMPAVHEARLPRGEAWKLIELIFEHAHRAKQCDPDLNHESNSDET